MHLVMLEFLELMAKMENLEKLALEVDQALLDIQEKRLLCFLFCFPSSIANIINNKCVMRDYEKLREITRIYEKLQEITRNYKKLRVRNGRKSEGMFYNI